MSDFENELLGLAENGPLTSKKRRQESKPKSKAKYADDSDSDSEMDMDLESEEGDGDDHMPKPSAGKSSAKPKSGVRTAAKGVSNPYPVEGKYLDEDDRDELDGMPEIEREAILAARQEEMQKYKDSQQLDAMYRMAGMGGDEESEEEPSRKKRKHTSVSKEATRAMKDLKNKRKAKDERDARKAQRRERRHRSDEDASSGSDEDGEISHSQPNVPYNARAYSPDRSPVGAGAGRRSPKRQDMEKELDATPPDAFALNSARLSRYEIVEMMYKEDFETLAVGCYVRLVAPEPDENGRMKYRIHRIEELQDGSMGRYNIEYKDKQISEDRVLLVSYGKARRLYRIADVSNGDVEPIEYHRFEMTNRADGVKIPKRSDLSRKHTAIRELRDRAMTSDEINRQVEARKRSNPAQQRHKITIEITNLIQSRNLAVRRNDMRRADEINREIVSLGGDPLSGELVTLDRDEAERNASEYDNRIEKINENNRKKVKDQMEKAHQGSLAKKRAEEAIVREKQAKAAAGIRAAKALEDAERARNGAAEAGETIDGENENGSDKLASLPKSTKVASAGLKKGETPQQFIARTIELDLGDF